MASAALYLRTNSCNPAYTGVPYRGTGKYSDCLLLLFPRYCTSPHLLRHRLLMCGTGRLSVRLHSFWLFVQHGCSRFHTGHPVDNSSVVLLWLFTVVTVSSGFSSPVCSSCFVFSLLVPKSYRWNSLSLSLPFIAYNVTTKSAYTTYQSPVIMLSSTSSPFCISCSSGFPYPNKSTGLPSGGV